MERNATIVQTPPRLSFYPLPDHSPSPSGMATPPIHVPGAIPFRWEEAPGKPKPENNTSSFGIPGHGGGSKNSSQLPPQPGPGRLSLKDLELPPRLQLAMVKTKPSLSLSPPIAGLDGRYAVGVPSRRSCSSTSFVEKKSRSCRVGGDRRALWLWRRRKNGRRDMNWECGSPASSSISVSSLSSSSSDSSGYYYKGAFDASWCGEQEEKVGEVRISHMRRCKSNPLITSQHASHWLASVYGALRHVIPKRREHKD